MISLTTQFIKAIADDKINSWFHKNLLQMLSLTAGFIKVIANDFSNNWIYKSY